MTVELGMVALWAFAFFTAWWIFLRENGKGEAYWFLGNSTIVIIGLLGFYVADSAITFIILVLTMVKWGMDWPKYNLLND